MPRDGPCLLSRHKLSCQFYNATEWLSGAIIRLSGATYKKCHNLRCGITCKSNHAKADAPCGCSCPCGHGRASHPAKEPCEPGNTLPSYTDECLRTIGKQRRAFYAGSVHKVLDHNKKRVLAQPKAKTLGQCLSATNLRLQQQTACQRPSCRTWWWNRKTRIPALLRSPAW